MKQLIKASNDLVFAFALFNGGIPLFVIDQRAEAINHDKNELLKISLLASH